MSENWNEKSGPEPEDGLQLYDSQQIDEEKLGQEIDKM